MAAEAAAAYTESDQLALANKHDLDTQKQITEGKGLQAEYDRLVQDERELAQRQRDEMFDKKSTFQEQVMAMNDQTMRAADRWKDLKKQRQEIEQKHHYEAGNTEKEEAFFKHEREGVLNERRVVDTSIQGTKQKLQRDAKDFAEAHHTSMDRFSNAANALGR